MGKLTDSITTGVSQAVFDAHTHNYRKIIMLGVDQSGSWANPSNVEIIDDSGVYVSDGTDLEAVGISVSTQPTGAPN